MAAFCLVGPRRLCRATGAAVYHSLSCKTLPCILSVYISTDCSAKNTNLNCRVLHVIHLTSCESCIWKIYFILWRFLWLLLYSQLQVSPVVNFLFWDRPHAEMARVWVVLHMAEWCPQLFHCPFVWMDLLLEILGLKIKLTCLHLRLRPNVCFYLKVSFYVFAYVHTNGFLFDNMYI